MFFNPTLTTEKGSTRAWGSAPAVLLFHSPEGVSPRHPAEIIARSNCVVSHMIYHGGFQPLAAKNGLRDSAHTKAEVRAGRKEQPALSAPRASYIGG